jgi:hypothetical protein
MIRTATATLILHRNGVANGPDPPPAAKRHGPLDFVARILARQAPSFLGAFRYIYFSLDKEANMPQKVIEIVGSSKESFAKAAENAVAEAAKTVRGLKWARIGELSMRLDDKKVLEYLATARIYFDVKR